MNLEFEVRFVDEEIQTGSSAHGWSNFSSQTIVVCDAQKPDAIQDTFLHEVVHAIYYIMGLGENAEEEAVVSRLSTGLCTVWRSNPKAFKWWESLV